VSPKQRVQSTPVGVGEPLLPIDDETLFTWQARLEPVPAGELAAG
jgi:hypothetical protein